MTDVAAPTRKPRKRTPRKYVTLDWDVLDAISGGYADLDEVRQELSDWKDNMEEKLSNSPKYSELEDALSEIEGVEDGNHDTDCLEGLELRCSVSQVQPRAKRKPLSRADRLANASAMLSGAADGIRTHIDQLDEEEGNTDWEGREELESLADNLEDDVSKIDGCSPPGMY